MQNYQVGNEFLKKTKKRLSPDISNVSSSLFLSQQKIGNTISVSNGLDSDQDRQKPDQDRLVWVQTVCKGNQHTAQVHLFIQIRAIS